MSTEDETYPSSPNNEEDTVKRSETESEEETDDEEDSSPLQSATGSSSETPEHTITFATYQLLIFLMCYLGYVLILYNRKSFLYTLPYVLADRYLSSDEVGAIVIAQTLTYSVSKFFSSLATDWYPPKYLFTASLFLTGFVMLAFSDQKDWYNLMLLTAANGCAQGLCWPSASKIIRAWYPPAQFGFWYALLASASSIVTTTGPGIAASLAINYGWKVAIQLPAMCALLVSASIPFCTWDAPSDVGYEDEITLGVAVDGHWSDLVGSDLMQMFVIITFLLHAVRASCLEWGQAYLQEERGLSHISTTSYFVSVECGGVVGIVLLGAVTDLMLRKGYYFGSGKSLRLNVSQYCVAGTCLTLNLFLFTLDPGTSKMYTGMLGFMMGFCMYSSTSILGTVTLEVASIRIVGAAHAFASLAGTFGSYAASGPIQYTATHWSWMAAFMAVNIIALTAFVILVIGKDMPARYKSNTAGPQKLTKT